MSKELKPCPFCGGEAVYDTDIVGYYFVCCPSDECNTQVASHHYASLDMAINAWNRRAFEPKSGTWKLESEFEGTKTWECPFCHEVYYFDDFTYKFCPACGAHLEMEEQS